MKKHLFLVLISALVLIATFSTTALAQDLQTALNYLEDSWLYDLDEAALNAPDIETLFSELQKQDKWAAYHDQDAYQEFIDSYDGDYIGIGVYLNVNEDGQAIITSVIAGGPAEEAGLQANDIITEVDGVAINGDVDLLQSLLLGEEGVTIMLKYLRDDEQTMITITRRQIQTASISYQLLENNFGFIRIQSFAASTPLEVKNAIEELTEQGMEAIMLDLNNCPGGLVESAVNVGSLLMGAKPYVFFMNNAGYSDLQIGDYSQLTDLPIAVLISDNTASAAELLAANIQDLERGLLVGNPSYGKGLAQILVGLPSGGGMSFSVNKFLSNSYQDLSEQGAIMPDIYAATYEQQLKAAQDWLLLQIAGDPLIYQIDQPFYTDNDIAHSGLAAVIYEGSSYLPFAQTMAALDWTIEDINGTIYAQSGHTRLIADFGQELLFFGQEKVELISYQDQLYFPARFLENVDYSIEWRTDSREIIISK